MAIEIGQCSEASDPQEAVGGRAIVRLVMGPSLANSLPRVAMTTHRLLACAVVCPMAGLREPHVTRWYCVRDVCRQSDRVRLGNRCSARAGCQAGGSGSNQDCHRQTNLQDDRLTRPSDPSHVARELTALAASSGNAVLRAIQLVRMWQLPARLRTRVTRP